MPNPSWENDIVLRGADEIENLPENEAAERMNGIFSLLQEKAQLDFSDEAQRQRIRCSGETQAGFAQLSEPDGTPYQGTDAEKKNLYDMVQRGRLFVYPYGETAPRQVQIGADGRPKLSPPLDDKMNFDLQPPEKPGLFKSFLNTITFGYAYREDFQTYERDKAIYEQAQKLEQALPEERLRREPEAQPEQAELERRETHKDAVKGLADVENQLETLAKSEQRLDALMSPKAVHVQELIDLKVYEEKEMPLSPVEHTGSLTDHEFAVAALAACASPDIGGSYKPRPGITKEARAGESYDFITDAYFAARPRPSSGQYGKVMDQARKETERAIEAMEQGDCNPLGKLLADGLKMNNEHFTSSQNLNTNAAIYGRLSGEMLGILEARPELLAAAKNAGLTDLDLKNARGAAVMSQAYRNGLEAQKEIHQAVLDGRAVDQPEARTKAIFSMEMVNRSIARNYAQQNKARSAECEKVIVQSAMVSQELDALRAEHADPEVIAQKAAEEDRLRLESAAFAYRGFKASDFQTQLGISKDGVANLGKLMDRLPDVQKLAQKDPMEIEKAMRPGGIRRMLDSAEEKMSAYRGIEIDLQTQRRLGQIDRTMDAIFAPRPQAIEPIVAEKKQNGVAMDREEFAQIAAHGYDLPENSKITLREAAAINLALSGAVSITGPVFKQMNPLNKIDAKIKPKDSFNMLVTGLFGKSRHGQLWQGVHASFDSAKEAIQEYQNGNPEKLGGYLGEGLKSLTNNFARAKISGLDRTSGGLVAKRILEVLDNHPDLMANSKLSERDLLEARGSVALGEISLNGLNAKIMLQQAAAGLRELSPEEKSQCLADMALLAMSDDAVETAATDYENSPEYLAKMEKMGEEISAASKEKAEFMEKHPEEIEKNFKQLYPDKKADLSKQYDAVYGESGQIPLLHYQYPISDYQANLGKSGALEAMQNQYRNHPALQNAAKQMSPGAILDTVRNPQKLGSLMGRNAPEVQSRAPQPKQSAAVKK